MAVDAYHEPLELPIMALDNASRRAAVYLKPKRGKK